MPADRAMPQLGNGGFLLLALVLLILAIGLGAGMIALNVRLSFDEQATKASQQRMQKIALAISASNLNSPTRDARAYEADVGKLPAALNDLVTKPAAIGTCYLNTATTQLSGWCGPYLKETFNGEGLFTDEWGTTLIYSTSPRQIRSAGPNRSDNGGGVDDLVQNY